MFEDGRIEYERLISGYRCVVFSRKYRDRWLRNMKMGGCLLVDEFIFFFHDSSSVLNLRGAA